MDTTSGTMKDPTTLQESANQGMGATSHEILTYLDDTSVQQASLPGLTALAPPTLSSGRELRTHTIEEILARPARVASIVWTSAQTGNDNLSTVVFPDILLQKPIIASKLANFTFLRADICIRIIANTTPFQAGKLLAYFSPLGGVVGERGENNDFLTSKTAFPHAILDASVGNVVEIRIPYVNPYNHYNLTNTTNEMGTLYVDVLNQLRSGIASNAPVSVFAWFENIDLSVPTAAPLQVPLMVAQVNSEEEDKSKIGVVTDVTSKFASFSKSAEGLPIVGTAFEPLTWMSNVVSRTAGALGLCKPQSVVAPSKYLNVPANAYTQGEGIDEGTVLAVTPTNTIQGRVDVFGSNVDEMDISYLTNRLTMRSQLAWDTGAINDIARFFVHPLDMRADTITINTVPYTYYEPTMLAYVAAAFDLWRGSLRYKIQVAKTAYHSGRLRISYVPGGKKLTGTYDYDHAYSWILDLRTSNEIEFEIPYTSVVPWMSTLLPDDNNTNETTGGVMVISVLNPLIAPSTVSSTVEINVWVSGGSDFELARPSVSKYIPVKLGTPDMVAQVNEDDQTIGFNDFTPAASMFSMGKMPKIEAAALCIGESVTNLRTIIKRSNIKYFGNILTPNVELTIPGSSFGKLTAINEQPTGELITPVDYFSWIYRFFRGGFNFKFFTRAASYPYNSGGIPFIVQEQAQLTSTNILRPVPTFDTQLIPLVDFIPFDGGNFTHRTQTQLNFAHEVKAPYYTNTAMQPIYGVGFPNSGGVNDDLPALHHNQIKLAYESAGTATPANSERRARIEVFKAAADDLQFGWVVGPPRIAAYTGVTTDSWTAL